MMNAPRIARRRVLKPAASRSSGPWPGGGGGSDGGGGGGGVTAIGYYSSIATRLRKQRRSLQRKARAALHARGGRGAAGAAARSRGPRSREVLSAVSPSLRRWQPSSAPRRQRSSSRAAVGAQIGR